MKLRILQITSIIVLLLLLCSCNNKPQNNLDLETPLPSEEVCYGSNHTKGEITHIQLASKNFGATFKCGVCGKEYDTSLTPEDIGMPILNFDSKLVDISKNEYSKVSGSYISFNKNFQFDAEIKLQGATSLGFDKKNYNIKLYKKGTDYQSKLKVELKDGWGKESKYCIKANWVDFSQSRNIVSGRIYSQIVKYNSSSTSLSDLANGGVVDGFPVVIYINGKYQGLYTINIPKDEWMFGMDDMEDGKQAIIMATGNTPSVEFKEAATFENGFELEYCSTEDDSWVLESFNDMIKAVAKGSPEEWADYIDIDRAIDMLIYVSVTDAYDNRAKNILWVTYDGKIWIPSIYDYDDSWGMKYDGSGFPYSPEAPISDFLVNVAFKNIYKEYYQKIVTRYKELRKGPLSQSNIEKQFSEFLSTIHPVISKAEMRKWVKIPSQKTNNIDQVLSFSKQRLEFLDNIFI